MSTKDKRHKVGVNVIPQILSNRLAKALSKEFGLAELR